MRTNLLLSFWATITIVAVAVDRNILEKLCNRLLFFTRRGHFKGDILLRYPHLFREMSLRIVIAMLDAVPSELSAPSGDFYPSGAGQTESARVSRSD